MSGFQQRRRKLIPALALGLAAGMMVTFFMVGIQTTRARQTELIRAREAAEVSKLRAEEAALKAESQPKHEH